MNNTMKTIHNLHSTHGNFTSRPVEDETIRTILDVCVRGANASNRQSYSIIVIRGEDKVQKILSCGAKSPAALLFCIDFNRIYDIGEYLGYESNFDTLFDFVTAYTDTVIAAQTAVIAATSLGVNSLYTNSIHNADRKSLTELYDELHLPDEHIFPVSAILLGYEDKPPKQKRGKLNGTGIVHYDTYKRLTDAQKEAVVRRVNDPKNHFWAQYGSGTYLEFFYTQWAAPRPAEMVKRGDDMLYEKLTSFIHDA